MIEKLNKEFVNTWVLRNDMIHLAGPAEKKAGAKNDPSDAIPVPNDSAKRGPVSDELRAFARSVREHYTYPVDSLVFDADGKFVGDLSAADLLMDVPGDKRYLELLEKLERRESKP